MKQPRLTKRERLMHEYRLAELKLADRIESELCRRTRCSQLVENPEDEFAARTYRQASTLDPPKGPP